MDQECVQMTEAATNPVYGDMQAHKCVKLSWRWELGKSMKETVGKQLGMQGSQWLQDAGKWRGE